MYIYVYNVYNIYIYIYMYITYSVLRTGSVRQIEI